MSKKTILVVDDVPLMRTVLVKCVKTLMHKIFGKGDPKLEVDVLEAAGGERALDCLKERDVDLILLDLLMPEMDGLSFLQQKLRDPKVSNIPVIVCSALGARDALERARQLGASAYVVKPFTIHEVEAKLRSVFEPA
jgi:CheY-like chemotaxis protein